MSRGLLLNIYVQSDVPSYMYLLNHLITYNSVVKGVEILHQNLPDHFGIGHIQGTHAEKRKWKLSAVFLIVMIDQQVHLSLEFDCVRHPAKERPRFGTRHVAERCLQLASFTSSEEIQQQRHDSCCCNREPVGCYEPSHMRHRAHKYIHDAPAVLRCCSLFVVPGTSICSREWKPGNQVTERRFLWATLNEPCVRGNMLVVKSSPRPNRQNIYPISEQKAKFCILFQTTGSPYNSCGPICLIRACSNPSLCDFLSDDIVRRTIWSCEEGWGEGGRGGEDCQIWRSEQRSLVRQEITQTWV